MKGYFRSKKNYLKNWKTR